MSTGIKKLQEEYRFLRKKGILATIGGTAAPVKRDFLHWFGCVVGPKNTPYADGTYYFEKQGNKYISNNQSKGNTVANSYIKVDLTNAKSNAKVIVNLSNIEKVYTDDPRKNPDAKPLDSISWADFRKMVGDEWTPGKNCPFDPIASKKASENKMKVICASGKNIPNIKAILNDQEYIGTTIG